MLPDDLPAVTRFDALLDALADHQPTGPLTGGLDPELVTTTLQLHAHTLAPQPDAAFARELRQSLLEHSDAVPAALPLRGSPRLGVARVMSIPDWRRGGWWPRVELAGMMLLVAAVLIILSSGGQWERWPGNDKSGNSVTGTSFQASPVPTEIAVVNPFDPSACPSAPIHATDAMATIGTVNPTIQPTSTPRPATGDGGTPADAALTQAITETVQMFLACRNTDDMSRILPYSTHEFVQTLIANPLPGSTWMFYPSDAQASPVPLPSNRWITAVSISGVRLISSNLVSATVVLRQPVDGYGTNAIVTTRWYFELSDGTWLIDESVEVAPITLETPTAEPTLRSQSVATDYRMVTTSDVHIRAEPSTDAEVVETVNEGDLVVVTDDPEAAEGYVWLPVTVVDSGLSGWIVEDWLIPAEDGNNTRVSTGQPPFLIGDRVQTSKPATIYAESSQSSMSVVTVPGQTTVTLTGPAVWDGTDRWWPVEVAQSGESGYILESYLQPNTSPPTPTASPSSTRFAVGTTVYVASERVVMREGSTFDSAEVVTLNRGTRLSILGTSVTNQGVVWWPVGDVTTGLSGFVVEEGLTETLTTPTPVPISQTGFVDPESLTEVSITIDAGGLLNGDEKAIDDATAALQQVLAPYTNCQVGFVQTFGYSTDIADGVAIARAVNDLLKEAFPEMFANAVVDDFANVGAARGQVEITMYFYRGCVNAGGVPPTMTPIDESKVRPSATVQPVEPTAVATSLAPITPTEQPAQTIVFLIDKSGSTSYDPLGGISKLDLEKETVRRAIAALPDGTSVGVIAFNDKQEWVVPVTELAPDSRDQIVAQLNDITPEGGSFLTPVLLNLTGEPRADPITGLTQIVLLADGKFADHDMFAYRDVIQGLVLSGVTFSTVAFGGDADTATMQTLAESGNGIYRLVETEADVPTLTIDDRVLVAT